MQIAIIGQLGFVYNPETNTLHVRIMAPGSKALIKQPRNKEVVNAAG